MIIFMSILSVAMYIYRNVMTNKLTKCVGRGRVGRGRVGGGLKGLIDLWDFIGCYSGVFKCFGGFLEISG